MNDTDIHGPLKAYHLNACETWYFHEARKLQEQQRLGLMTAAEVSVALEAKTAMPILKNQMVFFLNSALSKVVARDETGNNMISAGWNRLYLNKCRDPAFQNQAAVNKQARVDKEREDLVSSVMLVAFQRLAYYVSRCVCVL